MSWQQLEVKTTKALQETIELQLVDFGALSIVLEDAADQPILEPALYQTPVWDNLKICALFDAHVDLNPLLLLLEKNHADQAVFEITSVKDQDWVSASKDQFKPIQVTDNLIICPSWQQHDETLSVKLVLDPGLAFGTGSHPTTSLCLQQLDQINLKDKTLIDFGCGSGILGIAAILLGAKSVVAIDNDPQAIEATKANARKNHINQAHFTVSLASTVSNLKADIIVANILASPLISLSTQISDSLKEGGQLILSGILKEQVDPVKLAYPLINFNHIQLEQDWACLIGTKKP